MVIGLNDTPSVAGTASRETSPQQLWQHPHPETTNTFRFKAMIEHQYNVHLEDYEELRQWSVDNIDVFWQSVWHFTKVQASVSYKSQAVDVAQPMFPRPSWFTGARLNFAENLLYPVPPPDELSTAVIEADEETEAFISWKDLRERVRQCANAMIAVGVIEGDCVAGYIANHCDALVAMLSTTSIGALWTAISPDTGMAALLDRITQIDPVMLFADNAVRYNGKVHAVHDKLRDIVKELPKLRHVVVLRTVVDVNNHIADFEIAERKAVWYHDFVAKVPSSTPSHFAQLAPDHPIYILYSSGTTGRPKCIVHGAIGTLIQHKKEHAIQCSIGPGDRLFYFTTCTWMMWHWLVSGLASGATIVLYDGSPFRPLNQAGHGELAMANLIARLKITHFGTSAKYLSVLEQKAVMAKDTVDLSTLKAIYSTGSSLSPSTFAYVYRSFGPDINLGSITGGTDIISLFGAPSQISPVYSGEIQVRGLGMAVESWDNQGSDCTFTGEAGELVCVKPFPSQPIMFWNDERGEKYRQSYFETYPGIWHHGDYIRINPQTGGMIMLGRSDGVLKPAGVRFGSSEIYNVLLQHFPEVDDAVCVGRRREHDYDEAVILFLKMAQSCQFSSDLIHKVKTTIRNDLSARHVPAIVDETPEIPVTINGKKVEVAVKQILSGSNMKISASVANFQCLEWYRDWSGLHPE